VAAADWAEDGETLVERGPFDLVLGADVLYTRANADTAMRLLPRLVAPGGEARFADPGRSNSADFLAAIRATFHLRSRREGELSMYVLTPR
jgi:2-polyprenyl-3-methyl-5-hydroxy-6-metoxy-1,4-benzoquinol methylase